ncbi:hypothetical protein L3X38_017441 [Prunus dulcis]|uniref:Uncharacterized protein n=1 Tax=Prunus dulcis TaxID=3755 RepID=A0AAD4Z9S8_PRUDU|nr:hypothetical protein L3X38_017441 [Prunus dulcis]
MASEEGPNHGDLESRQNASPREEEHTKESAAAEKGSKQKGPSFVTHEDVIAMLEKERRAMLKKELSRSYEDWKYVS